MKKSAKRVISLPSVSEADHSLSYIARSIDNARNGCYQNNRFKIDEGYGDYNMNLFRLREKRQYLRNIPSLFSQTFKNLLIQKPTHDKERRIVTQHNETINHIITAPNQVYSEQIRVEREQQAKRKQEESERNKYVKGFDLEVRELNQQLSFEYLPSHQANHWFKVKDNSSAYQPPVFPPPPKEYFTTPKHKPQRRKPHIFMSDKVRKAPRLQNL